MMPKSGYHGTSKRSAIKHEKRSFRTTTFTLGPEKSSIYWNTLSLIYNRFYADIVRIARLELLIAQ